MQVPTTTPSTGYRNNILHISYCAAGVSRQGRRPEVIPAVSSFFPLFLPLLFHLLLFFSHSFIPLSFLSSLSYTPPIPLLYSRLPLLTPVPPFFLTLSSPPLSLRLISVTPHTPLLFPRLSLLTPVPTPFSSLTLSSPSPFPSLTFPSISLFLLSLFHPLSFLSSLSYTPPIPPPSTLFDSSLRTSIISLLQCNKSRVNVSDLSHFPPRMPQVPK